MLPRCRQQPPLPAVTGVEVLCMKASPGRSVFLLLFFCLAAGLAWAVYDRFQEEENAGSRRREAKAAPVKVAPVERGAIELKRTFSGALEAPSRVVVAPKVGGRIVRLAVDIADEVTRGVTVAVLDDEEYVQSVAQAEADLAVAEANVVEASNALATAGRELGRVETLRERGVASESQLDSARADELARQSRLEVARAQVKKAEAALAAARIRLGYTKVTAEWSGGGSRRVVAERFAHEGETVSANTPLLSIVELDPVTGVIFVPEKDYANLRSGQPVTVTTDAFPGKRFEGRIDRIAPVFREDTRQARVEIGVPNPGRDLKPGMFIRAGIVMDRLDDMTIVPAQALTVRKDQDGVFVVDEETLTALWQEVRIGIRDGDRVQVSGEGVAGRVVVLGQQLLDDGSKIVIPADE
jgi:RND family efflux transporter MFP subunit